MCLWVRVCVNLCVHVGVCMPVSMCGDLAYYKSIEGERLDLIAAGAKSVTDNLCTLMCI